MRDIRKDLKERLSDLASERAYLQSRLEQLAKNETMLTTLLEQEELRWKSQQIPLSGLSARSLQSRSHSRLGKFILTALSDGAPHRIEELTRLAQNQGVVADSKHPRKAVHFGLVGMKQNNLVEMVESGIWRIVHQDGGGGQAS